MEEKDKLRVQEEKFFETNVEGYWDPSGLTCAEDLFCSEHLYVE